jgi:hypothetical protein
LVADEDHRGDLARVAAGHVVKERAAEQVVDLAAGVLDRVDRVAGSLRRGDGPGEHQLGRVVDHVPGSPRPAAGGLKLEEVGLPDAIAARRDGDERFAARLGEVAALGDVVDREHQPGGPQDPQARGV